MEKKITSTDFLEYYTSVETEFLQSMEKLYRFRTDRLLDMLTKDTTLLTEDLEVITDSIIGKVYELSQATEIILIKNYVHFKQASGLLVDESDDLQVDMEEQL